ncbi:hypothetical protein BGZ82_009525 [Podila clonocystis]|nr:hypothetical protein BGZ82_009525 [Podila clonocystis]
MVGLQLFLLVPMRLAWKQCVAAPVLAALFVFPLVFVSTESPVLQLAHAFSSVGVFMRMFDLYFVTPWRTGQEPVLDFEQWRREMWSPFRNIPAKETTIQDAEGKEATEPKAVGGLLRRSVNRQSQRGNDLSLLAKDRGLPPPHRGQSVDALTPLAKDHGSSPLTTPQRNLYHWTYYIPRYAFHLASVELTIFILSFVTLDQIRDMSFVLRYLVHFCLALRIISFISLCYYSIMFVWALLTGQLIDDTDWTYVRHGFPLFAISPDDFWKRWHHLFQFIWVDLGMKPTRMLVRKYITDKKLAHHTTATALEMALPVMSVFVLSGLMHEYMILATWPGSSAGYMMAFFLVQGVATIASKGVKIVLGHRFGGVVPVAVWWVLNVLFYAVTGFLFLEPIIQNGGFAMGASQNVLVCLYNYLRAIGVF